MEGKTTQKATREERMHPWPQLFPEFYEQGANRGAALLGDAGVLLLAWLFARCHLLFGVYPFGIAYLAARRRRVVPCLLGLLLGASRLGALAPIYSTAYLLLFLFRVLTSLPVAKRALLPPTSQLFHEAAPLRIAAACLCGCGLGVFEIALAGASTPALLFAVTALLVPSVFAALFAGVYETELRPADVLGREGGVAPSHYGGVSGNYLRLSVLSLLFAVAFSLRGLSLFGLELSGCFTALTALFIAKRFGALSAGVAGLICGLCGSPLYAPAYAILGLLSGLLFASGSFYALLAGVVGACLYVGYVGGLTGFLSVGPECAVTALCAWPLFLRLRVEPDPAREELARKTVGDAVRQTSLRRDPEEDRLARLGGAFSDLSVVFYDMADHSRRPAAAEYFVECEKVCARYCASCSNRVYCWEKGERVAERTVYALANKLREVGRIDSEDLPPELRSGCRQMDKILEEIRDECATLGISRYRGDRCEFLSHDYAMLAKILEEAARERQEEEREDGDAVLRLQESLRESVLSETSLSVRGTRRKRVAAGSADAELLHKHRALLRERAEGACGCRLGEPVYLRVDGVGTLRMQAVRRYGVATALAAMPSAGQTVSGDKLRFFETAEDYFYAILSDGMGSGENAGSCASLCVTFLEKMLAAGNSKATTLRMLNNLIRTRENECSATVDMLIFDLLYGNAMFIKSGAAPSYLKRGGEIFRIRARTMPIGLMKNLDAERIGVEVKPGDLLILLSDGVCEEGEDPAWLMNRLAGEDGTDLGRLAEALLAEAVSRKPRRDDITVGVVRICEQARDAAPEEGASASGQVCPAPPPSEPTAGVAALRPLHPTHAVRGAEGLPG